MAFRPTVEPAKSEILQAVEKALSEGFEEARF
jgi:hypothetical protein